MRALLISYLCDDGDWRFRDDADRWRDDLDLAFGLRKGQVRLVIPREQHVADASLDEGRRCATGAGVEHGDVLEQGRDELFRLGVVATGLPLRVLPGSQVVPARATGRLRVGRDHANSRL